MRFLAFIFVLLLALGARADSMHPLEGYYRIGQFIPVRIGGGGELRMPGVTRASATSAGIVPALVYQPQSTMKELRAGQVLVASSLEINDVAPLFPGKEVVLVHVDDSFVPDGPAVAWETLDAIVIRPSANLFQENQRGRVHQLRTAGVRVFPMVAATPASPPRSEVNARSSTEATQASQLQALGAKSSIDPSVYSVVDEWTPGPGAKDRWRIVLIACVVVIALLAAALLDRRRAWVAVTTTALIATAAILLFMRRSSPVYEIGGDVVVASSAAVQVDRWMFQFSPRDRVIEYDMNEPIKPVFRSIEQVRSLDPVVVKDEQGKVTIRWTQPARTILPIMFRSISPGQAKVEMTTDRSPLMTVVQSRYAESSDAKVVGSIAPRGEISRDSSWPGVLVMSASSSTAGKSATTQSTTQP